MKHLEYVRNTLFIIIQNIVFINIYNQINFQPSNSSPTHDSLKSNGTDDA